MLSQEHGNCRSVTCTACRSKPPRFTLADIWSKTFTTIFTVSVANHYHPRGWADIKGKREEEVGRGREKKRYA